MLEGKRKEMEKLEGWMGETDKRLKDKLRIGPPVRNRGVDEDGEEVTGTATTKNRKGDGCPFLFLSGRIGRFSRIL